MNSFVGLIMAEQRKNDICSACFLTPKNLIHKKLLTRGYEGLLEGVTEDSSAYLNMLKLTQWQPLIAIVHINIYIDSRDCSAQRC